VLPWVTNAADVYLNIIRDLLVVEKGFPIPPVVALGRWRKSRKRVAKVSEEIRSAVQTQGYYVRKLRDLHRSSSGHTIVKPIRPEAMPEDFDQR
jgi:hypothetical protein